MAQKVKPVRGADADSVARTVHGPVNGDLNTYPVITTRESRLA